MANETTQSATGESAAAATVSVFDVIAVISARKIYFALFTIVSAALGILYTIQAEPIYQVTARVLVQPRGLLLEGESALAREKEFLATQSEIIGSPVVVNRALQSANSELTHLNLPDPTLAVLKELSVKPVSGTNVLRVTYTCNRPQEGIELVRSIVASYQHFCQEMDDDSRLDALHLLTLSEKRVRGELGDHEKAYRELRRDSPLVGHGEDGSTLQAKLLLELGQSLAEATARRVELENQLASYSAESAKQFVSNPLPPALPGAHALPVTTQVMAYRPNLDSPNGHRTTSANRERLSASASWGLVSSFQSLGAPNAKELLEDLSRAKVEMEELSRHCGPDHPLWQSTSEKVAALEDQIREMSDVFPSVLQRELDTAANREKHLQQLYQQETDKAKRNDEFVLQEQQALESLQRLQSIHSSLVVQLNDWRLTASESTRGTDVSIIEAPTIGSGPVWPKPAIVVVLSTCVGMFLGLAMIAWLERDRLTLSSSTRQPAI